MCAASGRLPRATAGGAKSGAATNGLGEESGGGFVGTFDVRWRTYGVEKVPRCRRERTCIIDPATISGTATLVNRPDGVFLIC
jgi:hypothetical protein